MLARKMESHAHGSAGAVHKAINACAINWNASMQTIRAGGIFMVRLRRS